MGRTGSFTDCVAGMFAWPVRWVATLKVMGPGTSETPNTAPTPGSDRTINLGIGNLDRNANDAVLQMMACKVVGSQRSSDNGFLQEHSAGDPGRQSRVKAANFFQNSSRYFMCIGSVYLTQRAKSLLFCQAWGRMTSHAEVGWNRVLLARTQTVFLVPNGPLRNDSEAIESQVK
jgi:hypothetical protein